jgi:thymidylate kinase
VPASRHALLIAAEGPDGAGKSAALDRLGRWLERKGRRVSVVEWAPSGLVRAAAARPGTRRAFTPRVSALLAAADDLRQAEREIRPALRRDSIVLVDRYAWTSVVREAGRGLGLAWSGSLRTPLPTPDLVLLFRQAPDVVVERALAARRPSALTTAVSDRFAAFARQVTAAYDRLVESAAEPSARPWPVAVAVIEPGLDPDVVDALVRAAVRPLLSGSHHAIGRLRPGDRTIAA